MTNNAKVSIIAPSKSIDLFKDQFDRGVEILTSNGFQIKFNQGGDQNLKYKIDAINESLQDDSPIVWCAVGGDSCFEILDLIDFDHINQNKILFGSSDNTHLVLVASLQTTLKTVFAPNVVNLPSLSKESLDHCFDYARNLKKFAYPRIMEIIRPGKASGVLFGGNLFALNNIIEKYPTEKLSDIILFFEDIEDEVTEIEEQIKRLKANFDMKKVNALVVGNISLIKKDKNIIELIKSEFDGYGFPIIKVDYFGHNVKEFYPFPIGSKASLDTSKKIFTLK